MYHNDFDENGVNETLLTYNKKGNYYPLNSKDELVGQMNIVSKIFIDHKSYAGKTINQFINPKFLSDATTYEAHTLASGYLKNNNGDFSEFVILPSAFQLAPINTFSKINISGDSQLLVGGNSHKVNTYHGSYTALKGLLVHDESDYNTVSEFGIEPFNGQIKHIETIEMNNKNLVLVVSNNDELKVYSYQK